MNQRAAQRFRETATRLSELAHDEARYFTPQEQEEIAVLVHTLDIIARGDRDDQEATR